MSTAKELPATPITKEFAEKAISTFKNTSIIDEDFLRLMHQYYIFEHKKKYDVKWLLEEFDHFKNLFQMWVEMPITCGNTLHEHMFNAQKVTFKKGIDNTIEHFNTLFDIKP